MSRSPRLVAVVLGVTVCVSAVSLASVGYLAVLRWRQSSELLAKRRAEQAVDRFVFALARDMQGAQRSVLLTANAQDFSRDLPYSAIALAASAFARFPYLESFFAWRAETASKLPAFFNRRDRLPLWMSHERGPNRFPVVVGADTSIAARVLRQIEMDGQEGRRFSVFETRFADTPYQVVARLLYEDDLRQSVQHVIGFTVNLEWVKKHYFGDLVDQLASIEGADSDVSLAVTDGEGRLVAGSVVPIPSRNVSRRTFAPIFFDPLLVIGSIPPELTRTSWAVEAAPAGDSQLAAALDGANRLLVLTAFACGTLVFGLILAIRAARASVELSGLRLDFVSSVSHELKAPLATIRAAGDSLVAGRVLDEAGRRDYARLMVQEATRLTRLVDNLLAFSRVTDVTTAYSFEPFTVDVLVETALKRFKAQLTNEGFLVNVNVPADLPPILADRDAALLMLENLLDNAVRYSSDVRRLDISGRVAEPMVVLDLRDYGRGIPEHELAHVTKRFYRGHNADPGGTGLGLAIAKRIASDHGGRLTIQSTLGSGTVVSVALPTLPALEDSPRPSGATGRDLQPPLA
jgi:two-component system phosphate regulon sensor histidine kinase PhoR